MLATKGFNKAAPYGNDRVQWRSDYPRILTELRERNSSEFDLRTVERTYYHHY